MPNPFESALREHGLTLRRARPAVLQINTGRLCNLTCTHCHVNAGPKRREIMTRATADRIVEWFGASGIPAIDLTGGAPEMIPDFRHFISALRRLTPRRRIMDRCNLTILLDPGHAGLAEFLAENEVEIIASMPCHSPENVDAQRGDGVFDASIAALQMLNRLGYGVRAELPLHLVYNPNGDFLPGPQDGLEAGYKRELSARFGVTFHRLYTLANLPVGRFAGWLRAEGKYDAYLDLLASAFNPATVGGLMCRDTISVSWEGEIHDCDFNQMLGLPMAGGARTFLWDVKADALENHPIATGAHCFGCTAGAGSSCGGAIEQ